WEMTPGTATDTEADEVFVVLAGRARIEFLDPPLPAIDVGPGSLVRLAEGMSTRWTVTETLRKVFIA
ncbi:MAG: cupin domain-containing protein, partial [Pseudoclavibacter sp.]